MSQSNNAKNGPMASVRLLDLLKFIQDKDARLGLVLSLFILLLLVASWFLKTFGGVFTEDGLAGLFSTLGWLLVAAAGFVVFFKAIDGTIVPRLIVWYLAVIVLLTSSVFWLQAVLRTPLPFLIEARCFAEPWGQGCPFGPVQAAVISPAPKPEEEAAGLGPREAVIPEDYRVSVRFAGAVPRDAVTAVSQRLAENGWQLDRPAEGGARTARAAGVDQVRYFHDEDGEAAERLALVYNRTANWPGFEPLSIARIEGHQAQVPLGYLEVWTSVD